ncbi:MAG TPA: S16 family serine protease [Elusimicrobiota bacterium]|nr:S16 family serine protease [Elusimicrobiota bacterium]
MRLLKFPAVASAFLIAAWPLCAPINSWAQADGEISAGADAIPAVPVSVGETGGFQAMAPSLLAQLGALDPSFSAVLPVAGIGGALSPAAGGTVFPAASVVPALRSRRGDVLAAPQDLKRAGAAVVPFAPQTFRSDMPLRSPASLRKASAAKAEAAVAELEGMSAAAEKGGAEQGAMTAAGEFDGGGAGRNGRPLLALPGRRGTSDAEDESEELQGLRAQLFSHVQNLKKASLYSEDPAAQAFLKKQAKEQSDLLEKIETAGMPQGVELVALRELSNMSDMNPRDSEAQKIKTYISWLTTVPWSRHTTDRYDLAEAKEIMDRDHSGLEGVKKRVLEFLTVRKRTKSNGGGILLFIGPPGVGKTSIAQAIAEAMGRKFVRFSLGGVADESNIRGHGRTYMGSQPGSIIRLMKQAGVNNPVMLLDEVDKMPQESGRGSAQPAFLEILDPEQNNTFQDHYMEVPYNLSNVLFIVTANDMSGIPPALRDRMEIVEFTGYTTAAKADIMRNQVLPQTARSLGLDPKSISMTPEAMEYLVESYTAEPGVRELKRQVGALLRGLLVEEEYSGKRMPAEITKEMVRQYLGREKHALRGVNVNNGVGYATGLAVMSNGMGGSVLAVEALKTPVSGNGAGKLNLRMLMKEQFQDSANNAYRYIRANSAKLGIEPAVFKEMDLDINAFPSGPIDGPSAGVTMTTALVSELTGRAVKPGVAMTGEVGLHGEVGAIGGLKDKVMAAYRLGYKTVIFPAANEGDLELLPADVRQNMKLAPVTRVEQVLDLALEPAPAAAPAVAKKGWWSVFVDFIKGK